MTGQLYDAASPVPHPFLPRWQEPDACILCGRGVRDGWHFTGDLAPVEKLAVSLVDQIHAMGKVRVRAMEDGSGDIYLDCSMLMRTPNDVHGMLLQRDDGDTEVDDDDEDRGEWCHPESGVSGSFADLLRSAASMYRTMPDGSDVP